MKRTGVEVTDTSNNNNNNNNNNNSNNEREDYEETIMDSKLMLSDSTDEHTDETNDENDDEVFVKHSKRTTNLRKDYGNIALLMFLYLLQGLPLGLSSSLPYILSSKNVSYADQGTFSFAFWPFSMKLLWAPLIDSIYVKKFGRRKSWLIPLQYLIGFFMFTFSDYVHHVLESNKNGTMNMSNSIYVLTAIFFLFTFLAATQDVVVDGWALTMLSKENVSWASTCNSVGQSAGWFIGNVVFLTLESKNFCNDYLRPFFGMPSQDIGIVTLKSFMELFGYVFIISTTLLLVFKRENDQNSNTALQASMSDIHRGNIEDHLSIAGTYKLMAKLLFIIPVRKLIVILLTFKIGFATESMIVLKLIEYGVPREKLSLLAVPLSPLQILLPLLISKYSNGPEPLTLLIKAIPGRLVMGMVCCIWVYVTPYFKDPNNDFPFYYYIICLLINAVHSCFVYTIFVTQVSFFARVSDKKIGGTYMTFLNTLANIGHNWPVTGAFYLASAITIKHCSYDTTLLNSNMRSNHTVAEILDVIEKNNCRNDVQTAQCLDYGAKCVTTIDAYYIQTVFCFILGFLWLAWKRTLVFKLERLPKTVWKIPDTFIKKILDNK